MPGQFLQPDHSAGDANTIGGYLAVHARPAAFEGSDGMSYSVEILTDSTGEHARPIGAYLLFVRWRRVGPSGVEGHLESEFLAWGATEAEARAAIGVMPLADAKRLLDRLIAARAGGTSSRRWWDAMRQESGDDD
jgi:hypothetical protein